MKMLETNNDLTNHCKKQIFPGSQVDEESSNIIFKSSWDHMQTDNQVDYLKTEMDIEEGVELFNKTIYSAA